MLEDVAVAAADAGALGDVDDAQRTRRRCAPGARRRTSPQRSQKRRCEARSRSPTVAAPGGGLVVDERRVRLVHDPHPGLPRPAGTSRRPRRPSGSPRRAGRPARSARAARTCTRRSRRAPTPVTFAGPQSRRLAAVAVVEPLRRLRVADRPAELDPPVGVAELRADDPDGSLSSLAAYCRQASQCVPGLHVRVEHDDVVRGVGRAQPAVDVRGEPAVLLAGDDRDALDRAQARAGAPRRSRRRPRRSAPARGASCGGCCARAARRRRRRGSSGSPP